MRFSRRQRLRSWLQRNSERPVDEPALRRLQGELRAAQPPDAPIPHLDRLADELHHLGGRVRFGDLTGGDEDRLFTLASLADLEAELGEAQRQLSSRQRTGDTQGVARLRMAARRARRRALRVAGNARVAATRRAVMQEMGDWLLLWLEMPEAFFDWLEVRQRTVEYRALAEGKAG